MAARSPASASPTPLSGDPHPAHHILFQYQTALVHRCESIPKFSHFCHSFQTVPAVTLTVVERSDTTGFPFSHHPHPGKGASAPSPQNAQRARRKPNVPAPRARG